MHCARKFKNCARHFKWRRIGKVHYRCNSYKCNFCNFYFFFKSVFIYLQGKINETKQELVVSSFQYRIFDRPQWELLQRKLTSILNNVKWAHKSIRDAKAQGAGLSNSQKA